MAHACTPSGSSLHQQLVLYLHKILILLPFLRPHPRCRNGGHARSSRLHFPPAIDRPLLDIVTTSSSHAYRRLLPPFCLTSLVMHSRTKFRRGRLSTVRVSCRCSHNSTRRGSGRCAVQRYRSETYNYTFLVFFVFPDFVFLLVSRLFVFVSLSHTHTWGYL